MIKLDFNWKYFKEDVVDFISEHKLLTFGIVVVIIMIPVILFFIRLLGAANDSYEPPKKQYGKALTSNPNLHKNMGILLLGLDKEQDHHSQRADSIIVVMYNANKNTAKTIRIPRDLYVKTNDYEGKINGLYDKEGTDGMMKMVSDYVGVPMTHYVKTDFEGLTHIVDKVGGINVDSNIKIDDSNNKQVGKDIHVDKGHTTLSGREALAYSRIRYIDNDIKRGERQQEVIKAIVHKLTEPKQLAQLDSNLKTLSPYVKTNIKVSDVVSRMSAVSDQPDMVPVTFDWDGFDYKKASYVKISQSERTKISKALRREVGLNPITLKPLITDPTNENEVEDVKNEQDQQNYQ
jgi:LCP family protein required for cell wall assembly